MIKDLEVDMRPCTGSDESRKFEYISDVVYFALACHMDESGALIADPTIHEDIVVAYRAGVAGDSSVLDVTNGKWRNIWAMSAVGNPDSEEKLIETCESSMVQPINLDTAYVGALLIFDSPDPCPPVVWVGCPWDDPSKFDGGAGRFRFEIPGNLIEEIHRDQTAAHASSPFPVTKVSARSPR